MPFKSQAQRRFIYWLKNEYNKKGKKFPINIKEWERETPKNLPEYVGGECNLCDEKCRGKWCKKHKEMIVGSGFIEDVKYRVKSLVDKDYRNTSNRSFDEYLKQNGNKEVESISVGRTPINKGIDTVLNVLSLGNYNRVKKRLKYDDVYHQYFIVNYKDGTKTKWEKNSIIEARNVSPEDEKNLFFKLPTRPNENLTLNELYKNAKDKYKNIEEYSAENNNCQDFIKKIVDSNKLIPDNVDENKILQSQDAKQLINSLPTPLKSIPFIATEISRLKEKVIDGKGLNRKNVNELRARAMIDGLI
jgi:hypothetical protein